MVLPPIPVGSYPTFSPLSRFSPWRLFSVILLWTYIHLSVRKHGILYCPDFPPRINRGDRTACEVGKITNYWQINPNRIINPKIKHADPLCHFGNLLNFEGFFDASKRVGPINKLFGQTFFQSFLCCYCKIGYLFVHVKLFDNKTIHVATIDYTLEKRFIVAVSEHRSFGFLILPFLAETIADRNYF